MDKVLSTLATIVADFGDSSRRFRRLADFDAASRHLRNYSHQCGRSLGIEEACSPRVEQSIFSRLIFSGKI